MKFRRLSLGTPTPEHLDEPQLAVALLRPVPWDDHDLQTLFHLSLRLTETQLLPIGLVKILSAETDTTRLPDEFTQLDDRHVSLGQGPDYFENLDRAIGSDALELLRGLRDLTALPAIERESLRQNDRVVRSLLRFSSARYAYADRLEQHPDLLNFRVSVQIRGFADAHEMDIGFQRNRMLGRMVVLIGENGAGKTQFLQGLVHPMLGLVDPPRSTVDEAPLISKVIAIAFGAFDRFRIPRKVGNDTVLPYDYCGLRRYSKALQGRTLVDFDFALSALAAAREELCQRGHESRWRECLGEFGLTPQTSGFEKWVDERSAGQKFICFVFTMLLAKLRPGALVLFDEPEIHTHPRMLTTLMRLFYAQLEDFDAFAILTTHSPIVLQEVPARQVRVIRPVGASETRAQITTYPRECFAEALDEIVKSGFGIDLSETNYVLRLRALVREHGVEAVEDEFARASLSARLALGLAKKLEADDA